MGILDRYDGGGLDGQEVGLECVRSVSSTSYDKGISLTVTGIKEKYRKR